MEYTYPKKSGNDTKKVFCQKASCSHTFFYLLNREFGHLKENEERAARSLAGGVLRKGHQCGMLWGAALAAGAEAYRRCKDQDKAIGLSIRSTQQLIASFTQRTQTVNCREITLTDFSKKLDMTKYLFFKARTCLNLADQWASEAKQSVKSSVSQDVSELPDKSISCATEVVTKMEASEEEKIMVAGFAGGLGLSGETCGALSAAIWMKTLALSREYPGKSTDSKQAVRKIYQSFCEETHFEMSCQAISGRCFKSLEEHTEFIENGGCKILISKLARF